MNSTANAGPARPASTKGRQGRLPAVVYVLALGTFLMGTTEFVVAGLLPELARDFEVSVAHAGLTITVFAVGMIVGAPSMAIATLRIPRRLTLVLALMVFAVGHVVVALSTDFGVVLAARLLTAFATGAFWAIAAVVAVDVVDPGSRSGALGIVLGGGMLANVLGVPLGALAGQLIGWRGPFWGLAVLAAIAAAVVARAVPADAPGRAIPSIRAELRAFRSLRLWLVLATCAMVTGGVLSVYSFIAPLLTERAGLPATAVPLALAAFGVAALIGSVVGGRLGNTRPYATAIGCAIATVVFMILLALISELPTPVLIVFTLLGLTGLSANPILVGLAVRFGGAAPTLASAMSTSIFNAGTAAGTAIAGATLGTPLGAQGPVVVGVFAAALTLVPLGALIVIDRRHEVLVRGSSLMLP